MFFKLLVFRNGINLHNIPMQSTKQIKSNQIKIKKSFPQHNQKISN